MLGVRRYQRLGSTELNDHGITILGAGVLGLWQAVTLARKGYRVTLFEASTHPFANAASRWAGAMLAPDCEAESAPRVVRDLGRGSLALWRGVLPGIAQNGTLVIAAARDRSELQRFASATERHVTLDDDGIAALEPDLAGRFPAALHYAEEAHFDCMAGLEALLSAAKAAGADVRFGVAAQVEDIAGIVIDCRGFAARGEVAGLRGVRGERLLVHAPDVRLARPVRLLHPRQPIYVVPQGAARYVVGATVIEREDDGEMTVRSALELLGSAYALHPAFAEAAILDMGAGVRPAFADNVPRVIVENGGRLIRVNGAYRHGFLLGPVLGEAVAGYLETGASRHALIAR